MTADRARRRAPSPPPRSRCPRSASPSDPRLRAPPARWQPVGAHGRLHERHLRAARDHDRRRASARSARRPSTSAPATPRSTGRGPRESTTSFVAISTRCMHLGCPVRFVEAAKRFICPCHGGVYDFRGAGAGGPPVRPLDRFYTRVRNGQVEIGPRFRVNCELERFSPPRSRPAARRHRPVPVSRPPLDPEAQLADEAPRSPRSAAALKPAPQRPGDRASPGPARRRPTRPAITAVDWVDERTSLSGGLRWLMFRKVPKGTNWFYTLGLGDDVRLPLAGGHRRVPGDVLRPVGRRAPTSRSATSPTRSSSASSCAACTSGARR